MTTDFAVSDADLPAAPDSMPVRVAFNPTELHWQALEEYINTGGSVSAVVKATGMASATFLALTRRKWWREQLVERSFVPVTVEELGEHIVRDVGAEALQRLGSGDYLSVTDLTRLGTLGLNMTRKSSSVRVGQVNIGNVNQIDFRGMSDHQLAILAGEADDFIEADFIEEEE